MENFTPSPVMILEDLETLKVLADPFRNQILEVLAPGPLTVNQIAEKLGLTPSKLYYHINMMEKHNLIKIIDTTVKANIIEKHYWIMAYEFKLAEALCNFSTPEGQNSVTTTMVAPIETTLGDIKRSLKARAYALDHGAKQHPREVVIYRELRNIPDELATKFIARLNEVMDEFNAYENQERSESVQTHALTIAFYPSFYFENPNKQDD